VVAARAIDGPRVDVTITYANGVTEVVPAGWTDRSQSGAFPPPRYPSHLRPLRPPPAPRHFLRHTHKKAPPSPPPLPAPRPTPHTSHLRPLHPPPAPSPPARPPRPTSHTRPTLLRPPFLQRRRPTRRLPPKRQRLIRPRRCSCSSWSSCGQRRQKLRTGLSKGNSERVKSFGSFLGTPPCGFPLTLWATLI
jgi:hypothetical protein